MTELATQGRLIVEDHTARRSILAERIRRMYGRDLDPEDRSKLSPELWATIRRWAHQEAERLLYRAPERLATRLDVLRYAQFLDRWAVETDRSTNWDALWCGQQDALGATLDQAHADARALRAYARTMKGA